MLTILQRGRNLSDRGYPGPLPSEPCAADVFTPPCRSFKVFEQAGRIVWRHPPFNGPLFYFHPTDMDAPGVVGLHQLVKQEFAHAAYLIVGKQWDYCSRQDRFRRPSRAAASQLPLAQWPKAALLGSRKRSLVTSNAWRAGLGLGGITSGPSACFPRPSASTGN